ncbi:DUF6420 family protein [Streptomyces sp. NPDC090088]|uniref:DUF6420 family protein n=1 Tax=Streptomyces sp. NPDC090088 TaxID=3365944 RepID=UPI0037FC15B1
MAALLREASWAAEGHCVHAGCCHHAAYGGGVLLDGAWGAYPRHALLHSARIGPLPITDKDAVICSDLT